MKARWVFIYGALLLLLASGAYGDGAYERTKDGKTLVWNNYARPQEEATWSGHRDADGYATGYGTLTRYAVQRVIVTGSNIPLTRYTVTGSYSGNMVQGKFDGPVLDVDVNGKKFHATFDDGRLADDWALGPAPSPSRTGIASDQQSNKRPKRAELVEAPAEGPSPVQRSEARGQRPEITDRPTEQHVSEPAVAETPGPASDDSIQALVGPPSLLRMKDFAAASPPVSVPSTASSRPARPSLTETEVIALADAEARTKGYDLGKYQRPQTHYTTEDDTWSVSYDQKSADGMAGNHFSVSVEDKTKKASIAVRR